jgi:hypothetical protein
VGGMGMLGGWVGSNKESKKDMQNYSDSKNVNGNIEKKQENMHMSGCADDGADEGDDLVMMMIMIRSNRTK